MCFMLSGSVSMFYHSKLFYNLSVAFSVPFFVFYYYSLSAILQMNVLIFLTQLIQFA